MNNVENVLKMFYCVYILGPIETDMYMDVAKNCCNSEMKNNFMEMRNAKKLVKVEDSVAKLILILKEQCYENGRHIDFYEEIHPS